MFDWLNRHSVRGRGLRERHGKLTVRESSGAFRRLLGWPVLWTAAFAITVSAISLSGEDALDHVIGERIDEPIYAKVTFQITDFAQTASDREAARAKIPSYYVQTDKTLTFDRIRADLMRLYDAAADENTFEGFAKAMKSRSWPAERGAYDRLRELVSIADGAGRGQFQQWVDALPLEGQYVVKGLSLEARTPPSTNDFILLETKGPNGESTQRLRHSQLVQQGNESSLEGSATRMARELPSVELRSTVEEIILGTFKDQPTIAYNKDRTHEAMKVVEKETPEAKSTYEEGKPFVSPGILDAEGYALLKAHQDQYLKFLGENSPVSAALRRQRFLQQAGQVTILTLLCVALTTMIGLYHSELLESRLRSVLLLGLFAVALAVVRVLDIFAPHIPELVLAPCVFAASVLAIAYPRRFAIVAACMVALLAGVIVDARITFLIAILLAAAVTVFRLDDIRSRTKVIKASLVASGLVMAATAAGGLLLRQTPSYLTLHALAAAGCVVMTAFLVSGLLPFIERTFRIATSLTLLEWRDPTQPLLQLLAREAPGTYNHSLVLSNLAEAACQAIGANGLLTQVGALYHDIGKVHRAAYFTENQEGRVSRHENLAPTMSLLIILGHVKDGLELARQHRLPPVLYPFIGEHHGTTVVRYFHQRACDVQTALGKNDRAVAECDYRYGGPKPQSRELAVLMICDSVEGAVRALPEPTPNRIETTVHKIVSDRLSDGQFDECDITLREIRLVEESVVKNLCAIHHGRIAYPAPKKEESERTPLKISV
ncbi:MAG: HDIG domain-containing protein [Planctomycetes bacterium]|nr:HDIG domain-containing protein [Planctomycetota bacterium]MBI3834554.1 HDIG domain-containing protein [Planctomycetota bacterium]